MGVRISLSVQSFCMKPLTPLDGTIAGMIYTSESPSYTEPTMFERHEGIAMASYPIYCADHVRDRSVIRFALKAYINTNLVDHLQPTSKGSYDTFLGSKAETSHRGSVHLLHVPNSAHVEYYMSGDVDALVLQLEKTGAIGAWTGRGYGQINRKPDGKIDYYIEEMDHDLCGILDPQGALIRPIPVNMAKELKIDPLSYTVRYERAANPYNPRAARQFGYSSEMVAVPNFGLDYAAS